MLLCSKFEDSVSFGYLETELKALSENYFVCSMIYKIEVMASYALLHLKDLPQIYLWSKFQESIPCGYLETELDTTEQNISITCTNEHGQSHPHTNKDTHEEYCILVSTTLLW